MAGMSIAEMMTRIPVRAVASETLENGLTVLLRPKFMNARMGWLQRLLPRPVFRVRLDAKGTCIWASIDGQRTVQDVCGVLREQFGAEAEPVEERAIALIHHLASGGFIRLD